MMFTLDHACSADDPRVKKSVRQRNPCLWIPRWTRSFHKYSPQTLEVQDQNLEVLFLLPVVCPQSVWPPGGLNACIVITFFFGK